MKIIKVFPLSDIFPEFTHKIVGNFFGKDLGGLLGTKVECLEKLRLLNLVTENPYDGKSAPLLRAIDKIRQKELK